MVALLNGLLIGSTIFVAMQWQFYNDPKNEKPPGETFWNETPAFWMSILIVVGIINIPDTSQSYPSRF